MIRIEGVSKKFDDLVAVDNLSLHIKQGEIFGLLGPNGAGKSTIISMISGQQLPSSGTVQVNGRSPTSLESKRLLGVAPQSIALYEELSALDNLTFFGSLYSLGRDKLKERIATVLDFVGLTDQAADRVEKYSGGMASLGWGVMMVFAMFGGAMIPLFMMPDWMITVSNFSPVKWAILSFEGATWREFSYSELMMPLGIMLAMGIILFFAGARMLKLED